MARKKKAVQEEEAPPAPQQEVAEAEAAAPVEGTATPLFEAAKAALDLLVETNHYQMDARYKERGKEVIAKLVAAVG